MYFYSLSKKILKTPEKIVHSNISTCFLDGTNINHIGKTILKNPQLALAKRGAGGISINMIK